MRHGYIRLDAVTSKKSALPAQGDMMPGFGERLKTPAAKQSCEVSGHRPISRPRNAASVERLLGERPGIGSK
jgi:hypothetical protein